MTMCVGKIKYAWLISLCITTPCWTSLVNDVNQTKIASWRITWVLHLFSNDAHRKRTAAWLYRNLWTQHVLSHKMHYIHDNGCQTRQPTPMTMESIHWISGWALDKTKHDPIQFGNRLQVPPKSMTEWEKQMHMLQNIAQSFQWPFKYVQTLNIQVFCALW